MFSLTEFITAVKIRSDALPQADWITKNSVWFQWHDINKDIIQIKLTDPLLVAFDNTGKKKLLQNFTSAK